MKWITLFMTFAISSTLLFSPIISQASDNHKNFEESFKEICGQTGNTETLSVEEITKMVAQCDTLKEKISASKYPKKKVLLFRLEKCRNFFEFIIQTKQLGTNQQ